MKLRISALALAAIAVAACGPEYVPWPKTAGETTCAEWIDEMSLDNRQGLARGVLTALWESDGAAEEPGDAVVLRFANAIGGTCSAWREETVSSIAGGLYSLSDDVKPGSE